MRALAAATLLLLPLAAHPEDPPARPALGLEEVVRTALQNQPRLRQARASRDAASARAESARAPLLPQVRGAASLEWTTTNPPRGERAVGASATLSQVLLDAGQLQRWRAASASTLALESSERATALQIAADARSAFFAARAARDLVEVTREALTNEEAHLRQVQAFVEVGTRPEIDLAQARAARANAAVSAIQAENGYDTARAALLQAMGVERASDFDVGDDVLPPVEGEDAPLDALVAEAAAARPELAAFRDEERAQELARSAARAGWLPTVGAQTGLVAQGPSPADAAAYWSTSVTLGWSFFQGGATRAAVRQAEAALASLRAQEDQFRQQIRLEIEEARLAVRASRASLAASAEALAAARDRLRLAEGRYQAGAGSIIELGDAQVASAAAAAQRVRAEYDLAAARAQLLRALGRPVP
jgi:outer membrane protein